MNKNSTASQISITKFITEFFKKIMVVRKLFGELVDSNSLQTNIEETKILKVNLQILQLISDEFSKIDRLDDKVNSLLENTSSKKDILKSSKMIIDKNDFLEKSYAPRSPIEASPSSHLLMQNFISFTKNRNPKIVKEGYFIRYRNNSVSSISNSN